MKNTSYLALAMMLSVLGFISHPASAQQQAYFYAWGGGEASNAYIAWAGKQVEALYDIKLTHVPLNDTGEAVRQVLAEKAAGADQAGKIDLIWINGENFKAMKQNKLLYGPFANKLENWALLDPHKNPNLITDFTVPTDGYEMPWGQARLVFYWNPEASQQAVPPDSPQSYLAYAKAHKGRLSYPAPPDFTGTSFLKQLLLQLTHNPKALEKPPIMGEAEGGFIKTTAPLWEYLDKLHPLLWQEGKNFPNNKTTMLQLFSQNILDIGFSFDMAEAANAVNQGLLPPSVRSFVWQGGTLGNSHFIAIPYNSQNSEAALKVANFLLSPMAQAKKQDSNIWGDATVLDLSRLQASDRAYFDDLTQHPSQLTMDALGPALNEPHPDWVDPLEQAWLKRYGSN